MHRVTQLINSSKSGEPRGGPEWEHGVCHCTWNIRRSPQRGSGIKRRDSKGRSLGNIEIMNNTYGIWQQGKLEDRSQVTEGFIAKIWGFYLEGNNGGPLKGCKQGENVVRFIISETLPMGPRKQPGFLRLPSPRGSLQKVRGSSSDNERLLSSPFLWLDTTYWPSYFISLNHNYFICTAK